MKFSVIIPVYNVEKYLEKCLLSVLNQTFQDFQIIIVIDGATDGSESIARRIKMEHPQADMQIIVQKNKGLGGARNTGMEYAAGDYWQRMHWKFWIRLQKMISMIWCILIPMWLMNREKFCRN